VESTHTELELNARSNRSQEPNLRKPRSQALFVASSTPKKIVSGMCPSRHEHAITFLVGMHLHEDLCTCDWGPTEQNASLLVRGRWPAPS